MKVEISSALRRFVDGERILIIEGNTLFEIFDQLALEYPELAKNIFFSNRELRSFVTIFIDGKNQVNLNEDIILKGCSVITFVPSIAGG